MSLSRKHLKDSHTPEAIAHRIQQGPAQVYVKDMVFGSIDGAVTTFAVVTGVAGAGLSSAVIIVLGLANMLADGFSMAAGNYLGTRSENQYRARMWRREMDEVETYPEGEREEVRQLFLNKGIEGKQLEQLVEGITSDKKLWVNTMLQEEHGMVVEDSNPVAAGWATFAAFVVAGALPLASYLVNWLLPGTIASPLLVSCVLTLTTFATVGAIKGRYVNQSPWMSALETLLVGSAAALLAFLVGYALKGYV